MSYMPLDDNVPFGKVWEFKEEIDRRAEEFMFCPHSLFSLSYLFPIDTSVNIW